MRETFRQSMALLHTWAGLLPGWLAFIIFFFGTVAVFDDEITAWMKPELYSGQVSSKALDVVDAAIREKAPSLSRVDISLPTPRGKPLSLSWDPWPDSGMAEGRLTFNPVTGQTVKARATRGGGFLYDLHYELYGLPEQLADFVVGGTTLFMLVAVLSGIVTHRKLFADFFLLRLGKGQRSWLDAHNITAVLALPFHVMIIYTGLVLLLFTLMPWAVSANFASHGDFSAAIRPDVPDVAVSGTSAPPLPLIKLTNLAEAHWGGAAARHITITHPGDAAAVAELYPAAQPLGPDAGPLRVSAATGDLMLQPSSDRGAAALQDVMENLHEAGFAMPALRWLYFLSGAAGTVMIASGLVLWTVKRRRKLPEPARPHFGFLLVERLNAGVIAGAPAATATYFLANRLLSLGLAHRVDWEINCFFIGWGALFVWTLARPTKQAWVEALSACAALYLLVPIVNALSTARGLVPSLVADDWVFAGFDLVMLAAAGLFAVSAWKVATHRPRAKAGLAKAAASRRMEAAE